MTESFSPALCDAANTLAGYANAICHQWLPDEQGSIKLWTNIKRDIAQFELDIFPYLSKKYMKADLNCRNKITSMLVIRSILTEMYVLWSQCQHPSINLRNKLNIALQNYEKSCFIVDVNHTKTLVLALTQ